MKRNFKNQLLRLFKNVIDSTHIESSPSNSNKIENDGRRKFIKHSSVAALGIGITTSLLNSCNIFNGQNEKLSVAIIGGGIAGLHAGHVLKNNNITFKLFEATERTGGRIFTVYNTLANKTSTELGGEFIDSNHEDMLNLVKEFDLTLLDMEQDIKKSGLTKDSYFFDGKHYKEEDLIREFSKFSKSIKEDIQLVVEEEDENSISKFDSISIDQYLSEKGCKGWLLNLLTKAYTSEMGMESNIQSSLNLIYMLDADTSNGFRIFGDSDERYKIDGGNSKLIDKLSERLKDDISTSHSCTKIEKIGDTYEIHFSNNNVIKADYIIIAIPFTSLRKVELKVNMPEEKKNAISQLGYGKSSKIIFGFDKRYWRDNGFSGYLFSDVIQNGWDSTAMQNNNQGEGTYTVFLGGESAANLDDSNSDAFLQEIDKIYPGSINGFNRKKVIYNWAKNSNVYGGYSSYSIGQWSTIAGHEQTPVDNMFFAGEHCSEDFQGYMNGGAETGRVAAEMILSKIQKKINPAGEIK